MDTQKNLLCRGTVTVPLHQMPGAQILGNEAYLRGTPQMDFLRSHQSRLVEEVGGRLFFLKGGADHG